VELVERNSRWETVGAGIAVQPNGMRVLRELGLGASAEQAGSTIRRWPFRDQHGAILCDVDLRAVWGDADPFIGIERSRLHETLVAGAARVPCRLGLGVASLRQGDRVVSIALSDGTRAEYAAVVGADGIHSNIRQLGFEVPPPVYGGQMAWRSIADIPIPEMGSS